MLTNLQRAVEAQKQLRRSAMTEAEKKVRRRHLRIMTGKVSEWQGAGIRHTGSLNKAIAVIRRNERARMNMIEGRKADAARV